ncbi:MAG: hypothetical protein ACHQVS_00575 [Candidatus Babeliales bacterium]
MILEHREIDFWVSYFIEALPATEYEKKTKCALAFELCKSYELLKDETLEDIQERSVGSIILALMESDKFQEENVRFSLLFFLVDLFIFIKKDNPHFRFKCFFSSLTWVAVTGFFSEASETLEGLENNEKYNKLLKVFCKLAAEDINSCR